MTDHSTEIAAKQICELTDPALIRAALLFVGALAFVDTAQWPLETHDTTGKSGKPGSRPPGRAMFASQRRRLTHLAEDADRQRTYVVNVLAKVRGTQIVEEVGGVRLLCAECHKPLPYGLRASARFCSGACKSKAARARRTA